MANEIVQNAAKGCDALLAQSGAQAPQNMGDIERCAAVLHATAGEARVSLLGIIGFAVVTMLALHFLKKLKAAAKDASDKRAEEEAKEAEYKEAKKWAEEERKERLRERYRRSKEEIEEERCDI